MVARWVDVWEPGRLTHGRRGGKKERGSTEGREGSEAAMGNYTCFTVRRRGAVQQARAAALTNSTKGGRITKAAMQQQPTITSSASPQPGALLLGSMNYTFS